MDESIRDILHLTTIFKDKYSVDRQLGNYKCTIGCHKWEDGVDANWWTVSSQDCL